MIHPVFGRFVNNISRLPSTSHINMNVVEYGQSLKDLAKIRNVSSLKQIT